MSKFDLLLGSRETRGAWPPTTPLAAGDRLHVALAYTGDRLLELSPDIVEEPCSRPGDFHVAPADQNGFPIDEWIIP